MLLSDLLTSIAVKALDLQNSNGSFPAGHNGPYHDPETPLRNSGHWLITFSKCYELTEDEKYIEKIKQIVQYLTSEKARPNGYSFHHRNIKGKDRCNGLIGPAWTIEALVEASRVLNDDKYASLAREVFLQHPFNYDLGLWNRLEIDGRVLSMDETFNHQLWFAACGSLIDNGDDSEIMNRVNRFMDCLPLNLTILKNGLIHHHIERLRERISITDMKYHKFDRELVSTILKARNVSTIKSIPFIGQTKQSRIEKQLYKSNGYHSFNMYAFALLKNQLPSFEYWNSVPFKKAVDYMLKDEYYKELDKNKYGYPYNPPGFEVPYSLLKLKNMNKKEFIERSEFWINEQFKRTYDHATYSMSRNNEDPLTLTARIYELSRLPADTLRSIEVYDESISGQHAANK